MLRKSLPLALITFALVSLLSQLLVSRQFVGEARLYFPGVQPQLFTKLTQSLQAQPELANADLSGNNELAQMAPVILRSLPARQAAQTQAGLQRLPLVEIETEGSGAVHVLARGQNAKVAHDLVEGLLNYYTDFVKRTPLTRTAKARADVETRLTQNVKGLTKLEDELVRSNDGGLRKLGDGSIKADPKVMSQVWTRRLEEGQMNQALLKKLARLRAEEKPSQLPGSDWLQQWAGNRLQKAPVAGALGAGSIRRQDLLKQAKLERDYYDALLLHRSLLLQRSFLQTWDKLENSNFELVEPISVTPYRPSPWRSLLTGLAAAFAVLVLRIISSSRSSRG